MSQYGQMTMPGYGNAYPMQQPYQQPMQQPMTQDTRDYINRMRQQIDQFEQRFSQPPPMPQQPMQQPMAQPQQTQPIQDQLIMVSVASMDEAQNYPPDLTGKKQWFVCGDEIYSKQFNVKTAGLEFHKYAVNDSEPEESPPQAPESKPDPQPKQDEIDALRAEIAALNDKYKELEGKVNAKSDVVQHDGRKQPAADDTKHDEPPTADSAASATTEPDAGSVSGDNANVESGDAAKPNNRKRDTAKAGNNANPTRPDSK